MSLHRTINAVESFLRVADAKIMFLVVVSHDCFMKRSIQYSTYFGHRVQSKRRLRPIGYPSFTVTAEERVSF